MTKWGVDVLFDDRACSAGEKFADADLIGAPLRVVVSAKTVAAKKLEVKERASGKVKFISTPALLKMVR